MVEDGDMNTALMVDGNAVAGELQAIFGQDMTVAVARCANCGAEGAMATLLAFPRSPGIVLRCPACQAVLARIVQTPAATYMEARGAAFLKFARV